jgi:plasmid stabilization system protein ParE
LPLAITSQRFKTVAWRRPQVAEIARSVEVAQFPARHLDQIGRKALGTFAIEDGLSGLVPEVSDHTRYVSSNDTAVKVSGAPRSIPMRPYFVFYAPLPEGERILVWRVIHGARELRRLVRAPRR